MQCPRQFLLLLISLTTSPVMAQSLGVQLKVGSAIAPTRSEFTVGRFLRQSSEVNRFVIGPAVEFRFTPRIALEVGVLFQSADLRSAVSSAAVYPSGSWSLDTSLRHVPVLAKYRFSAGSIAPFAVAGAAVRSYSHSAQLTTTNVGSSGVVQTTTANFDESHTDAGWAVGGGVEFKFRRLRVSPEVRYMRFGDFACGRCLDATPSISVNPVIFMLGIGL